MARRTLLPLAPLASLAILATFSCHAPPDELTASAGAPLAASECAEYPVRVTPDPSSRDRVTKAFAAIAPKARVTFADARGTASNVTALDASLGSCPFGRSAGAKLRSFVDAHRDAFQIDLAEWDTGGDGPLCNDVSTDGEWISWRRSTYGGLPIARDVVAFRIARVATTVRVLAFTGTYLPPASSDTVSRLEPCEAIDAKRAAAAAYDAKLPYRVMTYCVPETDLVYSPSASDTFTLGKPSFDWSDATDAVVFASHHEAKLVVADANVTPELRRSDAACPNEQNQLVVGWKLRFDSPTAKLEDIRAGIDCIVCAR